MANTVSTIFDNLKTIISTEAPAGSKELRFPRDLDKNDSRTLELGWGLRFLAGPATDGVTKAYTIDQGFEIILTRTNPRQDNESDVEVAEKLLFDAHTDILKELVHSNLNATAGVLRISAPDFSEPELLGSEDQETSFVALRVQVTITYRQQIP